MAKRFTDTNKYRKPFIRGLQGAYKLLWDYLYHDCDHAGVWIVDFEIAQIYIGSDMPVNKEDALKYFNKNEKRIVEFDNGKKWFIPSFIEFQYGILNEQNRAHNSVILILKNKGLTSFLQGAKDKDKEQDMDKDKDKIDYENFVLNYHNLCPKMNKVEILNTQRKGFINARVSEFGSEKVIFVIRKAGESEFLNGKNDKAWKADFEWILRPTNFVKILEGKYDNNTLELKKENKPIFNFNN